MGLRAHERGGDRAPEQGLRHLIVPELTSIAEIDGQPVGAGFALLDYNQIIKKIGGRLFPFGWYKFLTGKREIDRVRVISTNVLAGVPEMGPGDRGPCQNSPRCHRLWGSDMASSHGSWRAIRFHEVPLNAGGPSGPKSTASTIVRYKIISRFDARVFIPCPANHTQRCLLPFVVSLSSMPRSNVVITGMGVVSSIGIGCDAYFQSLVDKSRGSLPWPTAPMMVPDLATSTDPPGVWMGGPIVDFDRQAVCPAAQGPEGHVP